MVSGWGSPLYAALYLTTPTSRASRLADSDAEPIADVLREKKNCLPVLCEVEYNVRVPHGWPRRIAGSGSYEQSHG